MGNIGYWLMIWQELGSPIERKVLGSCPKWPKAKRAPLVSENNSNVHYVHFAQDLQEIKNVSANHHVDMSQ